ncbi:MAG: tetratricopeptide repeat protein [Saprospiraceae bacterium]|nr:tetratricopeptide repeat protein [Saprospiraceae bacterium]
MVPTSHCLRKAGDKAFNENDFFTAIFHYKEAMKRMPDDAGLWFKYAEVARHFNAFEIAEEYYTKVVSSSDSGKFGLAAFWLGQVKKCLGKYQEAKTMFEAFISKNEDPNYYTDWAIQEISVCDWASLDTVFVADKKIGLAHLDKKTNTPFSEFGAVEVNGTTYFTTYRFDLPSDKNRPKRKLSKVLFSDNKGRGKLMPNNFNDEKKLTAHTTISPDGQRLYFTICDYVNASSIRCKIAFRDKDKRGKWSKTPIILPNSINMDGFTATQPNIAFDSQHMEESLYFVSDRPGGKGKLDIWKCQIQEGKFGEPVNVGDLNTPENDITPFFHSPSNRLYFSSDGRSGIGGYDIFYIERFPKGEKSSWGEIRNLGKPMNSSFHDLYYAPNADGKGAYLSSNRPGSFYLDPENKACCHDIYKVSFEDLPSRPTNPIPTPPLTIQPSPPIKTFEKLEDFLPLALYFDNDEPDKRTNKIATKKTYIETYGRFFQRKNEFVEQYIQPITNEDERNEATLKILDFFEGEVKKGHDHLQLFSKILLKRLNGGERVEIVIKGYTSPRAKSDYNDYLAQRRISSLRNHFSEWQDSVFEPFLKNEKLVISDAPYGESQAETGISDDLFDERNSIYSVGASRERRVEIIEVK